MRAWAREVARGREGARARGCEGMRGCVGVREGARGCVPAASSDRKGFSNLGSADANDSATRGGCFFHALATSSAADPQCSRRCEKWTIEPAETGSARTYLAREERRLQFARAGCRLQGAGCRLQGAGCRLVREPTHCRASVPYLRMIASIGLAPAILGRG